MAVVTANALLKQDSDAFLLESSFELRIEATQAKTLATFVALIKDQHLAPGDSSAADQIGIDDAGGGYGPAGSSGEPIIVEGVTVRMGSSTASDFRNQATLPKFSRGLSGGPSFRTIVQETANGDEFRISKWQRPLRTFDIASAIDTPEDFRNLLKHYHHVRGALHGFRLRDPFDWSTHPNHMTKPDHTDYSHRELIGAGDGTTTVFQLVKRYELGSIRRARPITHPTYYYEESEDIPVGARGVNDDYVQEIYVEGVRKTIGTDYTIQNNGGTVTFAAAPAKAAQIEWCGTFDVPVRFDQSLDQGMLANMATTESYSLQLTATEMSIGEPFSDHRWTGGVNTQTISMDTALWIGAGRLWRITASTTGLKVYLPHTKHLLDGGPVMTICNVGSNAFDLFPYYLTTTKLTTLSAGEHVHLMLNEDGEFQGIE